MPSPKSIQSRTTVESYGIRDFWGGRLLDQSISWPGGQVARVRLVKLP